MNRAFGVNWYTGGVDVLTVNVAPVPDDAIDAGST